MAPSQSNDELKKKEKEMSSNPNYFKTNSKFCLPFSKNIKKQAIHELQGQFLNFSFLSSEILTPYQLWSF